MRHSFVALGRAQPRPVVSRNRRATSDRQQERDLRLTSGLKIPKRPSERSELAQYGIAEAARLLPPRLCPPLLKWQYLTCTAHPANHIT